MLAAVLLALAGTALASPISSAPPPTTSQSEFFNLVISVTDPSTDFADSPVNGLQLGPVHVGAGLNAPVPLADGTGAAFFSSAADHTVRLAAVASAGPYAITMYDQPEEGSVGVYDLGINVGTGTSGFGVAGQECPSLEAPEKGSFVVCDQGFEVYAHPKLVVKFVEGDGPVPDNCRAVRLVPVCAEGEAGEELDEGVPVSCFVKGAGWC